MPSSSLNHKQPAIRTAFRARALRSIAVSELSSLHAGRADWQSGESGNGGSREAAAILLWEGGLRAERRARRRVRLFLSGALVLVLRVSLDQMNEIVGQGFGGDFVVHGMQLLLQPHIERPPGLRRFHLRASGRRIGTVLLRLVVIRHGILRVERGAFHGFPSEASISPRENAHL